MKQSIDSFYNRVKQFKIERATRITQQQQQQQNEKKLDTNKYIYCLFFVSFVLLCHIQLDIYLKKISSFVYSKRVVVFIFYDKKIHLLEIPCLIIKSPSRVYSREELFVYT